MEMFRHFKFLTLHFVFRICILPFCLIFALLLPACKKDPGEGGRATITGKISAGNYHSPTTVVASDDFVAEEDVFIIYGDQSTIPNDDAKTSYDGSFNFKYLRPGKYKVFAYSTDTANSSPTIIPVFQNIEIKDKKEALTVDLTIFKEANDGGSSSIAGKVYAKNYSTNFSYLNAAYYAPDEDIYIIFGDSSGYNDRTRSDENGLFFFRNLRKGKYSLFAYSRDSFEIAVNNKPFAPDIAKKVSVEITSNNSIVVLPDIVIFN